METEQKVCSLELAIKLKELGVKQESDFCWAIDQSGRKDKIKVVHVTHTQHFSHFEFIAYAYDAAELEAMLPKDIDKGDKVLAVMYDLGIIKVHYWLTGINRSSPITMDKRLPNAFAKMLIYLIKCGKVKAAKVGR